MARPKKTDEQKQLAPATQVQHAPSPGIPPVVAAPVSHQNNKVIDVENFIRVRNSVRISPTPAPPPSALHYTATPGPGRQDRVHLKASANICDVVSPSPTLVCHTASLALALHTSFTCRRWPINPLVSPLYPRLNSQAFISRDFVGHSLCTSSSCKLSTSPCIGKKRQARRLIGSS